MCLHVLAFLFLIRKSSTVRLPGSKEAERCFEAVSRTGFVESFQTNVVPHGGQQVGLRLWLSNAKQGYIDEFPQCGSLLWFSVFSCLLVLGPGFLCRHSMIPIL